MFGSSADTTARSVKMMQIRPRPGAIEGHGGYLLSRAGDGVVAAFASPKSAVDAAQRSSVADTFGLNRSAQRLWPAANRTMTVLGLLA